MAEISAAVKDAAPERSTFMVAENEAQDLYIVKHYGVDSMWNDDFHHSASVLLTGHNEAYYSDYKGTAQEFVSMAKYGYLYQGQYYSWQNKTRGTPSMGFSPQTFIHFIQNHDQIANSCRGKRVHELTADSPFRAMTALLLLGPQLPLLFQGQEFASSSPFYYFAYHEDELASLTTYGRKQFLSQFQSISSVNGPLVPAPSDPPAFERCRLNFTERESHKAIYDLHKDLLRLRRDDPVILGSNRAAVDGAVLGPRCFLLRYFGTQDGDDRLLLFNFEIDSRLSPSPEPLLAPPLHKQWQIIWYSEDPRYGGMGSHPLFENGTLTAGGNSAYLLKAV